MQPAELSRAVAAAKAIASALGLRATEAVVLQNSNKLSLRLLPCDVFARVAPRAGQVAQFEVELAQRLAQTQSPVAALQPSVAPRPYEAEGFVVTLWTFYPSAEAPIGPAVYASALRRLHVGMRPLDLTAPHFTDRVAEARQLVADRALTPALADADRTLLAEALSGFERGIIQRGAPEQLLHGEPHPGNLLAAPKGPLFIDLETCCRGPVEFDLAHVPDAVTAHYPDVDRDLLDDCRGLVLAMVAAWRWDAADEFPDGRRVGRELVAILGRGPPWPTLDAMMRDLAAP